MTILTEDRTTPVPSRAPKPAAAAALLTVLMSAVSAYGAIYFTGLEGWTDTGATFVTVFEVVSLTGLVGAVALLRGSYLGWAAVLWYAAFQVVFTAFKLAVIHEEEATPFLVVALAVLFLATRPSVRAYATR